MEKDKIIFKGSHPDSLYRVTESGLGRGRAGRAARLLRWPLALFTICVALGVFVYFLVPSNLNADVNSANATDWEESVAGAQSNPNNRRIEVKNKEVKQPSGTKTPEIDFYEADTDRNYDITTVLDSITERTFKRKLPAPPVFPSHITPEIQYGNEKADLDKLRAPKYLDETRNTVPSESTLKPHITQKPEKPLAIYFQDGSAMPSSTEPVTVSDFADAESSNGLSGFVDRDPSGNAKREPLEIIYNIRSRANEKFASSEPPIVEEFYSRPLAKDVKFTSGHSKVFGLSIEEAEHMKSTTQHSLYNTRVSPTLPTWRNIKEPTTKKYPDGLNNLDVQCRSTSVPLCRGILPYDLAGPPVTMGRTTVSSLLPQLEYLIQTNCSERAIHFVCALLEPECSPQPNLQKLPCYNFCKGIVDSCEGSIPAELNSVFQCSQYSSSNCASPRSPCLSREMACGDGSCISRDWICDGTKDCPSGEDEASCSLCETNEYRCASGMCITKRWLCDGYSDCPGGDDESYDLCQGKRPQPRGLSDLGDGDLGEEIAGSAPAPSIRKPNRVPTNRERNSGYTMGESDSSKEILMTSDSNNALRRNFTRRPSPSRLSPYIRQKPKGVTPETNEYSTIISVVEETTKKQLEFPKRNSRQKSIPAPKSANIKMEAEEDMSIEFTNDEQTTEKATKKPTIIELESKASKGQTRENKVERHIDAAMMREPRVDRDESISDSSEIVNVTLSERSEEMYNSAHASPCPSGELRCVDGRCIALSQLCDGTIDCSDHADEDNCYT
ncbi:atrial natriuretic peptide-converting enzyme-like isoform X2 [Aricia agestis]|uniref:atrial natriuretic peptide-converting enzyme-like isoform X2 n=1 Tax=Aricia agestis TaxID=91739 RepID=UPI001C20A1D4|nr:atrial natriuretic peptide-converting enzyme-like isoform X2 [Aricia agestis]